MSDWFGSGVAEQTRVTAAVSWCVAVAAKAADVARGRCEAPYDTVGPDPAAADIRHPRNGSG